MSWTYSLSDIKTAQKDQVRFLIGDTDSSNQLIQDEEINFILSRSGTIEGAAAECCRSLAAIFGSLAEKRAGDTSIKFTNQSKSYLALMAQFLAQVASGAGAMPYAGGISIADKVSQEQNADRVSPQFNLGMDDSRLPIPAAAKALADQ